MTRPQPTRPLDESPVRPPTPPLRVGAALAITIATTALVAFSAGSHFGARAEKVAPVRTAALATFPTLAVTSELPELAVVSAHANSQPLPRGLAGTAAELEERIRQDGDDLESRRRLALLLVEGEQYVDAFQHAQVIAASRPDDPDALYVQSVVRLRMGQNQKAITDLEELLVAHPDHVDALRALGLGQLRIGRPDAAIETWERGLAVAGGHDPEIERLLAVSRAARLERATAG